MKQEGWFSWEDPELEIVDRLIFAKGERVRIMILSPKVAMTVMHFSEQGGSRMSRRCAKLDGQKCEDCEKGIPARPRFGVLVVLYKSIDPVEFEIVPFLFGKDKMKDFRNMKKFGWKGQTRGKDGQMIDISYPPPIDFHKHDLIAYCYNESFQKVKWTVTKDALWNRVEGLKEEILARVKEQKPDILSIMKTGSDVVAEPVEPETEKDPGHPLGEKAKQRNKTAEEILAEEDEEFVQPALPPPPPEKKRTYQPRETQRPVQNQRPQRPVRQQEPEVEQEIPAGRKVAQSTTDIDALVDEILK